MELHPGECDLGLIGVLWYTSMVLLHICICASHLHNHVSSDVDFKLDSPKNYLEQGLNAIRGILQLVLLRRIFLPSAQRDAIPTSYRSICLHDDR